MRGEFYKMDFRAWNIGTVDLTLEQEAAYLRLCHAMYDVRGPVPNSTRFLQSIFRCGNTKAATLVSQLIAAGKIAVTSDGRLINHRVTEELDAREKVSSVRRVAGERGGSAPRATAERTPSDPRPIAERPASEDDADARKPLKNNEQAEAIALTPRSRGEESREDKTDASHLSSRKRSDKSKQPILCPENLEIAESHSAKAAERGFDRNFVIRVRDRMYRWSHTTPNKKAAKKINWHLALFDFLERAMDEVEHRGGVPGIPAKPQSAQESFLAHSKSADLQMRGEDDTSPFLFDAAPLADAGGYANGHARPALLEPLGRDRGLPPPRYPGQTRPH